MPYRAFLVLLAALIAASGCGASLRTTISVYHILPDSPSRTAYAFAPLKDQESGSENIEYRREIRDALLRHRYVETDEAHADQLVSFSYSIDSGRERTSEGIFGNRTVTEYRRGLWVYIFEKDPLTGAAGTMLYEGGVLSSGDAGQLATAVPAMIDELFREFPGRSGLRRIVEIGP